MSPEAIQSLIEMFGVEKGVQILNLFTVPTEEGEEKEEKVLPSLRPGLIRSRHSASVHLPARETVNV
jgi:hypothetical protein